MSEAERAHRLLSGPGILSVCSSSMGLREWRSRSSRTLRSALLVLVLLLASVTRSLSAQADTDPLWNHFQAAASGDVDTQGALEEVGRARTARVGTGDSARLDAYEGAFRTMTAQETFWPPAKLTRAREGLALLDAAVLAAPRDPEVRYLRLVISHHLPSFFGRGETVRSDATALAQLLTSPASTDDPSRAGAMIDFLIETGLVSAAESDRLRLLRR